MIQKIKNIFFLVSCFIFIFLITKYYLSDQNIIYINKSRSSYTLVTDKNLPVLINDTNNIIIYKNDLEEFKKKKKRKILGKINF